MTTNHSRHPSAARRRMRGFSLIELAVVLVILGIIGILLVRWLGTAADERMQVAHRDLLQRADDALMGFVAGNARLPCPATPGSNGREDCGAGAVGSFPYVTLGLPDARAGRIRYGVLRRSDALVLPEPDGATSTKAAAGNADLAVLGDRAATLQVIANAATIKPAHQVRLYDNCSRLPTGAPDCAAVPQLYMNALDLCDALRHASLLPTSADHLHTRRDDLPALIAGNVAYALAITDALDPAPEHTGASLAFHSPRHPGTGGYHDKVHAVGLDQLWTRLRCGDSYGPAIHAHPNVAVAARLTTPAMHNYLEQLEIMYDLAVANDHSADAGLVSAAAQITSATAGVLDTIGETFETYGTWNWRVAVATVGIGTAVGGMIAAGVMKSKSSTYRDSADTLREEFRPSPGLAEALENAITTEARRADILGMFPDPTVRHVAESFQNDGTATDPGVP